MRGHSENKSSLMKTLKTEYKKQTNIVGGDIQNVVSLMNDIVGMTKSADDERIDSSEEDLKLIAKVFIVEKYCMFVGSTRKLRMFLIGSNSEKR